MGNKRPIFPAKEKVIVAVNTEDELSRREKLLHDTRDAPATKSSPSEPKQNKNFQLFQWNTAKKAPFSAQHQHKVASLIKKGSK